MKVTGHPPPPASPLGEPRTRPAFDPGGAPADAGPVPPARLGSGSSIGQAPRRAVRFDPARDTTHEFVRGAREQDPSPYIRNPAPRRQDAAPLLPRRTQAPTPPAPRSATIHGEALNDAPLRPPGRSRDDPDVGS